MSTEVRVYDMEDGHPCVVMVTSGTHDVSRLVNLLHSGRCEDQTTATYIRKTLSRHRGGRAALKLLKDHGGPDLVVDPAAPIASPSYLIWSTYSNAWWLPENAGRTADLWAAGRFTEYEAWTAAWHVQDVPVLAPESGMASMTLEEIQRAPQVMAERMPAAIEARIAVAARVAEVLA